MVENIGWVRSQVQDRIGRDVIVPIEVFPVNGEMAFVNWYRQGEMEYNGKYVVAVEYDRPPVKDSELPL